MLYGVTGWVDNQVLELDAIHNSSPSIQVYADFMGLYRVSFMAAARQGTTPEDNSFKVLLSNKVKLDITPVHSVMQTY